ncbi:MAG: hypothetical protein KDK10_09490 [Maritimibacter sp.]|nr:hypothetical protein [Maritimibacter sp.]
MEGETPLSEKDARLVRYLKWLVTTLTVTMIAGFIVLVAVVVMRVNAPAALAPAFPETIALPDGAVAEAVTRGPGYLLVVTTDGRALVFSPDGTTLRQELEIGG